MGNKKALTIDVSSNNVQTGGENEWSQLQNASIFIKNIITPKLSEKTNIGQLVSGIPTAFARVDMFKTAIDHVANSGQNSEDNNLVGYYSKLVDEWKGLIACIALDYAHISVRKIDLSYSDGKDLATTANVYEPKGAFGNMLLKRRDRWCEQNLAANQTAIPYINIVKYRNVVVGATAPESLLFTSTGYSFKSVEPQPWIDVVSGKFIDPLKSNMTDMQVATLHAYVSHIISGLDEIEGYYANVKDGAGVDYTTMRTLLGNWKSEIEGFANRNNYELSIGSTPPVNALFSGPFAKLFCHKDILFGNEGTISDTQLNGGIEFDPKNLLLDETAHIAKLDLSLSSEDMKNLPILVLTADVKNMPNEKAYFALPLSAQGLDVFGKNIAALVGMSAMSNAIDSTLKAIYDPNNRKDNLEVVLTISTNTGIHREFRKIYTCDGEIKNKDILIWPNFISYQWDAYFMYNELPHNSTNQSYRAFPFVGEMQENSFRILVDSENRPLLLSNDGQTITSDKVKAELLVMSTEAVADNPYKYEIYRSDKPFKGVRLMSPTGNEGGYLLVNYSSAQGSQLPKDWMRPGSHVSLQEVRLGIDFGSTNTSIAYSSNNDQENGFEFENQRISLMGNELPGRPIFPKENQVFFFPGAGTKVASNAIKSVLTVHDNRRLPALKMGQTIKMRNEREVVGGFPCFADNLPFTNSNKNKITLTYPNGVGDVTQIHNMKWENTDEDKAHKSAFLKTLMLQVYATLFVAGKVPESVKWSYPSAMAGQLLLSYQSIWSSLKTISPVIKENGERYDLKISEYIDTRSIGMSIGTGTFGDSQSNENSFGTSAELNNSFGGTGTGFGGFESTGFGGSFGSNVGFGNIGSPGFGTDSESQKATESVSSEDFMPDNPDREVVYSPQPLYTMNNANSNPSLSEAEAVANFISVKYGEASNVLNLCFDVGGSTTDISALFYLKNGVTMIKQNSIRFAAQRVSQSVAKFKQFQKVLVSICNKYRINIVGLNLGNNTYGEHTAPYFFDQIINRLNDNQLEDLYREIAAECPGLMCVNMYVTGLLMFYAGQIANKLVDDLNHASNEDWSSRDKPKVRVSFAGKGSRLFQWLNTINSQAATMYYGNMFILGYGEKRLKETLKEWQKIELPKSHDYDIKYEVSKGLAKGDTTLLRPKDYQSSEIIGESGFEIVGKDHERRSIDFTNTLTPAMLESIGKLLCSDGTAKKFTEFCSFFYTAARQLFNWNVNPEELSQACKNLDIVSYVQNMPEFRTAKEEARGSQKPFDFVAPIIILEGMKFYDVVLLNKLS